MMMRQMFGVHHCSQIFRTVVGLYFVDMVHIGPPEKTGVMCSFPNISMFSNHLPRDWMSNDDITMEVNSTSTFPSRMIFTPGVMPVFIFERLFENVIKTGDNFSASTKA